ncbi:expressed unknown protein [Seminavis robusta]|uniref:Uncharacterized protein n=1 Tax=Seminavis robusta TaxID=568900 RepID=A0A9N8HQX8_9STRA|nr:expressed unknown protein [Seminavis robusta]|eukprot:Sro1499_g277720.1 n/a (119) ;mRNA; f:1953-2309
MKDTVYKTRIPSVTKRRTCLQHFMRTGVQLWGLTIEEQRKVLSQEDGTCYAASENDYEWNDPEQPFIEIDDDNDEEEEQDEDEDEHESEKLNEDEVDLRKYKRWSHYHYIACLCLFRV